MIIDNCPNFNKIINFDYFEGDYFTANLIHIYRQYIFTIDPMNPEELNKVKHMDMVINKYIDDYIFRKEMKYALLKVTFQRDEKLISNLVNAILGIFEDYQEGNTRKIYVARWI